jgi:hypothetical protein
VVDISQMRGTQGLALAGVLLQRLFERNQGEFTKKDSRSILGVGGWGSRRREVKGGGTRAWVMATSQARARTDGVPQPREDWLPDDPSGASQPPNALF